MSPFFWASAQSDFHWKSGRAASTHFQLTPAMVNMSVTGWHLPSPCRPTSKGQPALAPTSPSPVQSTTRLARYAWRPDLFWTTTPVTAPSSTRAAANWV